MVQKLLDYLKVHKKWLMYIVFGVLTTVINYIIFFPLYNFVQLSAVLSNAIAWLGAVFFAFFTNKYFVFRSDDWSKGMLMRELCRFLGCRLGTGLLESLLLLITADILSWNGNILKLAIGFLLFFLNYLGSQVFVFRDKAD